MQTKFGECKFNKLRFLLCRSVHSATATKLLTLGESHVCNFALVYTFYSFFMVKK